MTNTTNPKPGAWIGIDLGTTNCSAAIWDMNQSSPKVLRLKHLARPAAGSDKGGKIVPSVVLFYDDDGEGAISNRDGTSVYGMSTLVGNRACADFSGFNADDVNRASVTSVKRVVGMTASEAKELSVSDPDFWNSLPFQTVIMEDGHENEDSGTNHERKPQGVDLNLDHVLDVLGGSSTNETGGKTTQNLQEGVVIRIKPLSHNPLSLNKHNNLPTSTSQQQNNSPEHLISPLQITTILLHSILNAANAYLAKNKKIRPPGHDPETNCTTIQNCIIGVPAHYTQNQRNAIQSAAKKAGFTGYVGVMTESTAAAMAYGLFVSPNVASSDEREKNVLVFDMGGGTTDVTVAVMDGDNSSTYDDHHVKFRVVATAGDKCLGGDNVDELLARHLWKKTNPTQERRPSTHQEFIQKCRVAKEQLCGNDKDDTVGLNETQFTFDKVTITITRQEFDKAIEPLILKAERVIDTALQSINKKIHEVILVGGSSHIPTIRSMLRRKFPPPIPPELCTSISAETAVSQGLAIQSALVSGGVPLWELRNAMMLDALPHSIGVWVDTAMDGSGIPHVKGDLLSSSENSGHYVEILCKDDPLPARGSATFTLANVDQFGVTVVAVERIGIDTFQCMGVFTFLLHRLDTERLSLKTRQIDVGMVLESNGRFIVSVFDDNDPEHREKKRLFLLQKGIESGVEEHDAERIGFSGTESGLIVLCAVVFALYVATRIAFSDLDLHSESDEL